MPAAPTSGDSGPALIDRYSIWEKIGLYAAILVFMTFILAPFVEAFKVSLRPMDALFRVPYQFFTDDISFQAYSDVWVPGLGRYIFNSFFIACAITLLALLCVILAAYSLSRFEYRFRTGILTGFLAVNMIGAAVLIIPLYKLMLTLGIRPDDLTPGEGDIAMPYKPEVVERLGNQTVVHGTTESDVPVCLMAGEAADIRPGQTITATFDPAAMHLFDEADMALHRAVDLDSFAALA